jgi:probable rRNA maturation factor
MPKNPSRAPEKASIEIVSYVETIFDSALFKKVAKKIVGPDYSLSIVICDPKRARAINKQYRKKTYTPNVLSFPLTKHSGELFLTPHVSDKEAASFGHTKEAHRVFLLIHGLLHLCGHTHGSTMEKEERRYMQMFAPSETHEKSARKK